MRMWSMKWRSPHPAQAPSNEECSRAWPMWGSAPPQGPCWVAKSWSRRGWPQLFYFLSSMFEASHSHFTGLSCGLSLRTPFVSSITITVHSGQNPGSILKDFEGSLCNLHIPPWQNKLFLSFYPTLLCNCIYDHIVWTPTWWWSIWS